MKPYEQSHPWLKFSIDLARAHPQLWILLGECQSKCEHIAGVPLRPETAQRLHQIYLAKGALASSAIEGNTLSEEEVRLHLEGKLHLPPSREYLAQEVDNIIQACNRILVEITAGREPALTPAAIMDLNRAVLNKLALGKDVVPGEIRQHVVTVARYRGAPAQDCEHLLERLCEWLGGETFAAPKGMEVVYAVLKAVLAHLYLAWIHPFGDGNGRTARTVELQILLGSGVPAPAAHLLSNHYNQTRTEYYRQLDQASRSGGEVLPFISYAVQGFVDGLREQLQAIRAQQWNDAWQNYVHEAFSDRKTRGDIRRRHLVLDLSAKGEPVPVGKLAEISVRVAREYAGKTGKTLARDLNAVLKMGLLERKGDGYRARKERILAFLPAKAVRPSAS